MNQHDGLVFDHVAPSGHWLHDLLPPLEELDITVQPVGEVVGAGGMELNGDSVNLLSCDALSLRGPWGECVTDRLELMVVDERLPAHSPS